MKSDLEKRFESILEEEEKSASGIYNKPFIVGVLFAVAVFIVSNSISYFISYNKYLSSQDTKIQMSGGFNDYYMRGFPFELCGNRFDCSPIGLGLNSVVLVFFSFFCGFLFRFVWSKISYRFVSVK